MSVQPGTYKIKNSQSGTYLDASARHQGQVHGWGERQGNKNQEWEVQQGQQGGYTLKNVGQNRYCAVQDTADGTRVEASEQPYEWDIKNENGQYALCVRNGGTCCDLDNGSQEDGASICLYGYRGAGQQKWIFEQQGGGNYGGQGGSQQGGQQGNYGGGNQQAAYSQGGGSGGGSYTGSVPAGAYTICNAQSNTNVDLAGGGQGDGVPVLGWQKTGGPNQVWHLESGQNGYRIKNGQTGTYLGYQGNPSEGTELKAYTQPTEFQVKDTGDGYQLHDSRNDNLVVDLAGGGSDNGVKLLLYNNGNGANQRWRFDQAQ